MDLRPNTAQTQGGFHPVKMIHHLKVKCPPNLSHLYRVLWPRPQEVLQEAQLDQELQEQASSQL